LWPAAWSRERHGWRAPAGIGKFSKCAVKRHHDVISIDRAKLGDEIPTRAVAEVQVFVLRLTRSLRLTTLSSSIESPEVRIEKFGGRFDLIKPDRASRQANRDPCLLADAASRYDLLQYDPVTGQA